MPEDLPADRPEEMPMHRRRRRRCFTAGTVFVLLAVFGVAWWMAVQADARMRADLLEKARLVAHGMDFDRLRFLSTTDNGSTTPAYRQLKSQLATIQSADSRCRLIRVIGRKPNGTIFPLVDSGPALAGSEVSGA